MAVLTDKLTNIVAATKQLVQLCSDLKSENAEMRLELDLLRKTVQQQTTGLQQMEEKVKALAVARTLEGEVEGEEVLINEKILDTKRKINDFVREIDKCIELLR